LARDCGVPVVPVALTGTADVLPKDGSYSPAPMRVGIGAPVDPNTTSTPELRAQVLALRDARLPETLDRYALVS
jgi:1-acyl-sn-glycerol-3-phosphate acyltransferase